MKTGKKWIRYLALLAGLGVLAAIVGSIGPEKIWDHLKKITLLQLAILLGLRILYWILRTFCWGVVVRTYDREVSFWSLFRVRMIGHSISQLTPTAQLGSEASRAWLAGCRDRSISVASVIVDKTIEYLTVVAFTLLGIILLFLRTSLTPRLKVAMISILLVALLFVYFFYRQQKKGLIGWLAGFLHRLGIRPGILEKNRHKFQDIDGYIADFYLQSHRAFFITLFLYAALIMLWATEIHLGLCYLGVAKLSFMDSFLLTILGNLAMAIPFIPGSLGIYELTYMALYGKILGGNAQVALVLVFIRRILALILAGLGLLGLIGLPRRPRDVTIPPTDPGGPGRENTPTGSG